MKEFTIKENSLKEINEQEITNEEIQELVKERFSKEIRQKRMMEILSDGFKGVEKNDATVTDVTVSVNNYSYIRELKDIFNEETSKEEILKGNYGSLWWATVHVEKDCDGIIFESGYEETGEKK